MPKRHVLCTIFAASGLFASGYAGVGMAAESYRLIHAIGTTERIVARELSSAECQKQKKQLQAASTALGTFSESKARASVTCLPESIFAD